MNTRRRSIHSPMRAGRRGIAARCSASSCGGHCRRCAMVIGESIPMLDSAARVTGAVEYLVNLRLPAMLVGKVVRSRAPHARLAGVDTRQAEQVPGVVAVLTGADLGATALYGAA